MNRVIGLMLFVLILSVAAFAQGSGSSSAGSAKRGERPFAVTKILLGKVAEVKADDLLLVIEDARGRKHEFRFTLRTKLAAAPKVSKPDSVAELEAGQKVRVTYREADKTATMIMVRSAKG